MRTALDAAPAILDDAERRFVASVREHGWYRTEVLGVARYPGFSFTTGFWVRAERPELIMFSMKAEIAHQVFWDLFNDARTGQSLPVAVRTEKVFGNTDAYAFPVARRHYPDHLGWSRWFYGSDAFPCLQVVWPDRAGTFPWEDGFDPALAGLQPDLTEEGWEIVLTD